MKRTKFAIFTLLVALVSAMCFALIACGGDNGPQGTTYKITWTVAEHATVAVVGYDAPPTELAENTEVTFTVTPDTGYAVSAVTPSTAVKKQPDGSYKFTATKDLEIKVVVREIVNSLTITEPDKMTYFAGESVDKKGMVVTVNYATGRSEATEDYIIEYANGGEAFALGETGFNVTYGGVSETITFDNAIVGKITLDLAGGTLADEDIAKLQQFTGYEFDQTKGIVSWTFAEAFAEEFVLPTPTKEVNGNEFPFVRWGGVTDGKIAKDNAVSVKSEAIYDPQLLSVQNLEFVKKNVTETVGEGDDAQEQTVEVPFLVIRGKFVAATEAYLYLEEGNAPKTELVGPTVKKSADSDDFTLEFDLRELVDWVNPDPDAEKKQTLKSAWNDIKFRAKFGDRIETQQINLANYPEDFVNLNDSVIYEYKGQTYRFGYKTHTPDKTDEVNLKLVYDDYVRPNYELGEIKLEERNGKPYLVINATYMAGTTKEDAERDLNGFIRDIQKFPGNADALGGQAVPQTITVNADLTFEVAIDLSFLNYTGNVVMHAYKSVDTAGDENFNPSVYSKTPITVNDVEYKLDSIATGWGWNWFGVTAVDKGLPTPAEKSVELSVEGEGENAKLFLVVKYEKGEYTQESFANIIVNFDFQLRGDPWTREKSENITWDFGEDTITLKIEISTLGDTSGYTCHLDLAKAANNEPKDFKPALDAFDGPVVAFNGKYYRLRYVKGSNEQSEFWGCIGLEVYDTDPTPAE